MHILLLGRQARYAWVPWHAASPLALCQATLQSHTCDAICNKHKELRKIISHLHSMTAMILSKITLVCLIGSYPGAQEQPAIVLKILSSV
jgi:hypothetical protein